VRRHLNAVGKGGLIIGVVVLVLSGCQVSEGEEAFAHTDLAVGVYPDSHLERVDVISGTVGGYPVDVSLMFGTQDQLNSVLEWYRAHYSKLGDVSITGRNEKGDYTHVSPGDRTEWSRATIFVRTPDRLERGMPFAVPPTFLKRAPIKDVMDPLQIFFSGREVPREEGELETKILVQGDYHEPRSSKRTSAAKSEQERLFSLWQTAKPELLLKEQALDAILQYPASVLADVNVEEGLAVGYLTVRLTFLSSATRSELLDHFQAALQPLGKLERISREGDADGTEQVGWRIDQGDPYVSTITVEDTDEPFPSIEEASGAGTATGANSRSSWRLQRRAPWLSWFVP